MGTTTNLKPCNPSHKLDYPNLPNIAALFRLAWFPPQHPGLELMVSFVGKAVGWVQQRGTQHSRSLTISGVGFHFVLLNLRNLMCIHNRP
jgi:hypothetical protein